MRVTLVLFLSIGFASCFLFKDYKRKELTYVQNGQSQTVSILVPKGYVKEEAKDTAGIYLHSFQYPGGATLYAAYLNDTTYELQSFNKSLHQPLELLQGGLVYKGQDSTDLFYRELRQGNFRFGYRNVSSANEVFFDSATNYAAWQKR